MTTRYARTFLALVAATGLALAPATWAASEYFVRTDGSDAAAGTSWGEALQTISNALNKASASDTITVSNGTYVLTTALTVNKALTLRSLNGPAVTTVDANGNQAVAAGRYSVMVISAAALVHGFTLKGGEQYNGGVPGVDMSAGTVSNCVITDNFGRYGPDAAALKMTGSAVVDSCVLVSNRSERSGACITMAAGTILRNSLIASNVMGSGALINSEVTAGVRQSGGSIVNCTIAGNWVEGGGVGGLWISAGSVSNSIICLNRNPTNITTTDYGSDFNVFQTGGTIVYSCATPAVPGTGNVAADPQFANPRGGDFSLLPGSPCLDAAAEAGLAVDRDGKARTDGDGIGGAAPDMGCYEADGASEGAFRCNVIASPAVAIGTNTAVFTARVAGPDTTVTHYAWDLGNGTTLAGPALQTVTGDYPVGAYTVRLTVTNSSSATASVAKTNGVYVAPAIVYVATDGSATFPFDTLAKAARSPQYAIDAAAVTGSVSSLVLVSNGTYTTLYYRPFQLYKGCTMRSVAGAAATLLAKAPNADQYRVLDVRNSNAVLSGFTVTNGYLGTSSAWNSRGGGIWLTAGTVQDCLVINNSSGGSGGGILMDGGLVDRCRIVNNSALHGYTYGGGGGILMNGGTVRNSLIMSNVCPNTAGSTAHCRGAGISMFAANTRVENCTVVSNSILYSGTNYYYSGAGICRESDSCFVTNTIVYGNLKAGVPNDITNRYTFAGIGRSCSPALVHDPSGTGNITNWPQFVDFDAGNYRLGFGSPCIDAGIELAWSASGADLDGSARKSGAAPDIGAYEKGAVPTTLAVTNLPASGLGPTVATLSGQILNDGNAEPPWVYICWDTTDRGTGATGTWAHVEFLGTSWASGGTFGTNVTSLLSGTTYVYRCFVSNSTGQAWAEPAESLRTVYAPAVTNLGAAPVGHLTATLRGQVLDTGGETPSAWFHYWQTAGSPTSVVAAGSQTGTFAQAVSGLSMESAYSYRILASNAAGGTWSDTQAFTTLGSTTYYVMTNGSDAAHGTNWANAKQSLHAALAAASNDYDIIVVSNGTYVITNTLVVDRRLTLLSLNGAAVTTIDAQGSTGKRLRVMTITAPGALVEGFTIRGGWMWQSESAGVKITDGTLRRCVIRDNFTRYGTVPDFGAGLDIQTNGVVENCTIVSNSVERWAAGGVRIASGVLRNCLVAFNSDWSGGDPGANYGVGGVHQSGGLIDHCTIARNWTGSGYAHGLLQTGGAVSNSIVYFNHRPGMEASDHPNASNMRRTSGTMSYSCTTPAEAGTGNVSAAPLFADRIGGDFRLKPGSPCLDAAGASTAVTNDLAETARPLDGDGAGGATPDMGCYEAADGASGALRCGFTVSKPAAVATNTVVFRAYAAGADTSITAYSWDFGNGSTPSGAGLGIVTGYFGVGVYTVALSVVNAGAEGANWAQAAAVFVTDTNVYVSRTGWAALPYDTWAKAATSVYDAVDAAVVDGATRSVVVLPDGTNTVGYARPLVLGKGLHLRSVNGAARSTLTRPTTDTTYYRPLAMLHANALVEGLTISKGYTGSAAGWTWRGGGVYMTGGTLRACIVRENVSANGGGIWLTGGLVDRCVVAWNDAQAGVTYGAGGGILMEGGTVRNSLVVSNMTSTLASNGRGGGISMMASGARVENCTVCDNVISNALAGATYSGGGIYRHTDGATVTNTIVYHNLKAGAPNDIANNGTSAGIGYTCSPDVAHDPTGTGSITNVPAFKDRPAGNYRPAFGSAIQNAGIAQDWMSAALDLAGAPRLVRQPDMGAYEWQPPRGTILWVR